ncbi:polysaccharide biosynthesis protein [Aliarcobacter cryaerophilus]|uniref:polysaccharide biosynthesis protein n=1 Tax=Aliarcobacter cryaerophilus TaxID=28198 RepID=UPI0021B65B4D|nr:nucleoside-diphosphate sugar epimerase/dehydratase [Aliarcobacter cryaerophilus]MCT7489232.1 polysaccharide biosynthesis protein [Aliarcobacter cryaerophilus]MCT7531787.1 polysaccharide biosynthesis protein [Aliarcobacter cryaerophilus]
MLKPTAKKRLLFFISLDTILSLFTLFLAYNLRFNFEIPELFLEPFWRVFLVILALKIFTFMYLKIYKVAWRFFSLYEVKTIIIAHLISYIIAAVTILFFKDIFSPIAKSILIIDFILSLVLIIFLRLSKRIVIESGKNDKYKKTLIIGANQSLKTFLNDKENFKYSVQAVVDDNKNLENTYIFNLRVYGFDKLENLVKDNYIETVIIVNEYTPDQLLKIYETLKSLKVLDIKLVNTITDSNMKKLKDITVEDLLARHPKDLDKKQIENFIKNKVVLITGAGGSIGSEISRKCVSFGAKQLILLDHSEYNLYSITEELKDSNIVPVMQTVRKIEFLEKTFEKYKPQIVIHAAAYKHVPLVEHNILEGITNNIIGTKNTIDLSIKYKVEKFVLISTDKAVRPTNVMGTTKRVCELYAQNVDSKNTEIVAVRFGNVLGSSGSVIPKFKAQIEAGKNITVTHPEITRYFMLIPEACELVLQAASIGKGGEIFILDMGEPIKIVDLAKKMIELSGRSEISIEFCGLRCGEKLYEELLIDDSDKKTQYESITVASPTFFDIEELNKKIEELLICEDKISKLKEIVPEFDHKLN